MQIKTWYNGVVSDGMWVSKKTRTNQETGEPSTEYIIRLGLYVDELYRSCIRFHREHPAKVIDGFVLDGYPHRIHPAGWHKLKKKMEDKLRAAEMIIPALEGCYRDHKEVMLRICTIIDIAIKTSNRKGEMLRKMGRRSASRQIRKLGGWRHIGGPSPTVFAKGFKSYNKNTGKPVNKTYSADDVLILKNGTAILIEPEGASRIDHKVVYNLDGKLHNIHACDFTTELIKPQITKIETIIKPDAEVVKTMPLVEVTTIEEEQEYEGEWPGCDPELETAEAFNRAAEEHNRSLESSQEASNTEKPETRFELHSQTEQSI